MKQALPEAPDSGVHYDIPPEIFQRLLDRNMNYSCGRYPSGDEDLDTAQICKMDGIVAATGIQAGARVLDIGCGWGGPALYLAERHGCHVTGINLSPVQRDHARAWARQRGLTDRVRIEVCDVLEMPFEDGSFDHILFLESIIHMEEKEQIFARCHRLLRPGGSVFIQESCYDRQSRAAGYRDDAGFREVDAAFGYTATMVSGAEMLRLLEEAGLAPMRMENISADYRRTLAQWLQRLDRFREEMNAISGEAWWMLRRYLMIALATYRSGNTLCHQITARKNP